jgi:hypothetical protein
MAYLAQAFEILCPVEVHEVMESSGSPGLRSLSPIMKQSKRSSSVTSITNLL